VTRINPDPDLLIFDLDGTLVDSQDQIARSFNVALCAAGVAPVSHARVYAMIGLPLIQMFSQVLPESQHHLVPTCADLYRADYNTVEIPRSSSFPGVRETLASCRAAGRTLTVATTKGQAVADLVIDTAGLRPYFSLVLGGDRVPRHKPAPDLVLLTLELTGQRAERALVVGDSSYDMVMADGAGVAFCGVTHGAQSADSLRTAGAIHLIDTMPELLPLIGLPR
jgi:phosphoglycolate phosphatase